MFQLFNADCLNKMKDISSNSIDLIICDLPFGCLSLKDSPNTNDCKWDVKIDLETFWKEIRRIRRDDHTPCLHFCTTKYGFELWESNKKEYRYDLVVSKTNPVGFLSANRKPMSCHEMIYVFSKAGTYYNRVDISGDFQRVIGGATKTNTYGVALPNTTRDNQGKRCVKSVLEVSNKKSKGAHPTQKPIELYKFLIERYCPEGGTVLDPTFGSCNSGIACKELGRNYIGIEKDRGFYEKAKSKLE